MLFHFYSPQFLQFMKKRNCSKVKIKPKSKFKQCHALDKVKIYWKQASNLTFSWPAMSYCSAEILSQRNT